MRGLYIQTGKKSQLIFWILSLFFLFSTHLSAATIFVGPPPASIQTAINGAADGDTIVLSAGTYVQEVQVISKNLTIMGQGVGNTTIQAPGPSTHLTQVFNFGGVNFWCIFMIDNQAAPVSQTVNISDLTVDGDTQQDTAVPPIYGNSNRFFAVGYHNANGTLNNVNTTNTRQTVNFNELAGGGILNASNTGTVAFNVTNCSVNLYQRLGIDCRGTALTASISNTSVTRGYVLPVGPITATPNGIQFSGSATGSITDCTVSQNISAVANAGGSGIILVGAGANMTVSGNTVSDNDNGIAAISCGNNLIIDTNTLNFTMASPGVNSEEGIIVQDTTGLSTITSNIMNNIPDVNMELISSTDQSFSLMTNQFIGSQTGLIVTGNTLTGPLVTMNSDSFTGTLGYYIQEVASPHDIWPSTASVSFDGLISGQMTMAQFLQVLTKIFDKHNDPALGLVLDFIPPIPAVSDVMPSFGPASGGNTVTITGANFRLGLTSVKFGSASATNVMVLSNTVLTAVAPAGSGTVNVTVTTPDGTSPLTPFDTYSYIAVPPPAVTNVSPKQGPSGGGTAINITGEGFLTGDTLVFFGDTQATNVVIHSSTMLTVIAPPGTGTVNITVLTPSGRSFITVVDEFTYTVIPVNPLPPSRFRGTLKKNEFLTRTNFILKSKWDPSPSPDIVSYRIYKGKKLVQEIPADAPLVFKTSVNSIRAARTFSVAAVNSDNLESMRIRIMIRKK